MDRALQQRLLGAVILTALLVILVPEWLDGSGHKSRYPSQIEMPQKPHFEPLSKPEPKPSVSEQAQVTQQTASPPTESPPPAPAPASKPEPEPEPESRAAIDAWALQVGSFSEQSNARVMRDRMRAEGYATYIHKQKSQGSMHYRVRIGPELDRTRVEKLKKAIQDKHEINGLVVKHP